MATYKVQAPDGHVIKIEGPDGASQADILAQAQKLYKPVDTGPIGAIEANARGASAGLGFNFDDELAAGLKTVLPVSNAKSGWTEGFGKAYAENLAHIRERDKAYEEVHPAATGFGRIEGALAGMKGLGLFKGSKALVTAAPVAAKGSALARSVGGGAAYGAVAGAGAGDTADSRLKSATAGAVTGAVVGGLVHGTVAGAYPIVRRYASALMGKNITQDALRAIRVNLRRDGYDVDSPDGVKALQTELGRYAGKPVSLADVGPNTRSRAVVGLRSPSEAQGPGLDVVSARVQGQPARLRKDITDTVAPRTDVHALDDALVEQRAAEALPLKQQALYAENPTAGAPTTDNLPQVVAGRQLTKNLVPTGQQGSRVPVIPDDPQLQNLARLPIAQNALSRAKQGIADETSRLNVLGQDTSHLPNFPVAGEPLSMSALDVIKRNLDTEVHSAYQSADSGVRAMAPELQATRDAIRDRMRAVGESAPGKGDGPYGQYLDQFAGASELRDALAAGRGANATTGSRVSVPGYDQMDPEVIAAEQAKRSEAGQEFYRVGAARNLVDKVNSTTDANYPSARILNSPESRDQLAATGVDPAALQAKVNQENTLNLLPRATRSIGAGVVGAAAADADAGLNQTIPYNFLSPRNIAAVLGQKALGVTNLTRNARVNEAVLPRLLETDPQAVQATINDLVTNGQYEKARSLASQAKLGFFAKLIGNISGSPVSVQEGK